jgi:acyl-CoA synthetase (AMP-forming)/AMP-acid ligase II
VNPLYKERELRHIVGDAEPAAVVVGSEREPAIPPGTPVWLADELAAAAATRPAARIAEPLDGDAPAVIVYTSGTTGAAKGAVLSHANLAANGASVTSSWRITDAGGQRDHG